MFKKCNKKCNKICKEICKKSVGSRSLMRSSDTQTLRLD